MEESNQRKLNCRSGDGFREGRNLSVDTLPQEVCSKVFSFLDHRSLASSLQVCRAWKNIASEDPLWKKLFSERWGDSSAEFYAPIDPAKSWKQVYEVQDRCDRVGMSLKIVREGKEYYLVYQGQIQRLLGSRVEENGDEEEEDAPAANSPPMLSEQMLFFLGDLEAACAVARRT